MNNADIAKYLQNLSLGSHISCIYNTDSELFSLLIPFFESGLKQHHKCVYVTEANVMDKVIDACKTYGFDLSPYIVNKDFVFLSKEDVYLKDGVFDPTHVLTLLKEFEADIKKQGYTALCVVGNASWLNEHERAASDFMRYEAQVNLVISESSVIAVCLYHEPSSNEQVLIDVLRTHPVIYLYNKFVPCKYFAPSNDFVPMVNRNPSGLRFKHFIESLSTA